MAMVDSDSFLIGTNLWYVYHVNDKNLTIVPRPGTNYAPINGTAPGGRLPGTNPMLSFQPYSFLSWFDTVGVGQFPWGSVYTYNPKHKNITLVYPLAGPEPNAGKNTMGRGGQSQGIYAGRMWLGTWPV